jgi:hypothetical protein
VLWVDRPRLASGLSDVVAELTATVPVSSWVDPVDDMARMATVDATVPDPVYPRIAGALADAAAVRGRRADQRTLTRHLAVFGDEVRHEQERIRAAALTAWNELPTGRAVGLTTVEGRLRRVGVSLPDGLHEVEKACATRRRGHNEEQVL